MLPHTPKSPSARHAIQTLVCMLLLWGGALSSPAASVADIFSLTEIDLHLISDPVILVASSADYDSLLLDLDYVDNRAADDPDIRLRYELLDSEENPVSLDNDGTTVSSIYETLAPPKTITRTASQRSISLKPAIELAADSLYTVQVRAQYYGMVKPGQFSWISFDTKTTGKLDIIHFPSTNPNDDNINVKGRVENVEFTQLYALDKVDQYCQGNPFEAEVTVDLYRYDNFASKFPGTLEVDFTLTLQLVDEDGNSISVTRQDQNTSFTRTLNDFITFPEKQPHHLTETLDVSFWPDEQLLSASKTYKLKATLSYVLIPGMKPVYANTTNDSPFKRLLHFNGTLQFGTSYPCRTSLTLLEIETEPGAIPSATGFPVRLRKLQGYLTADPTFYFSETGSTYGADGVLRDSGAVIYTQDIFHINLQSINHSPCFIDAGGLRLRLRHPDTEADGETVVLLDDDGAHAQATIFLPAGMGWARDTETTLANNKLSFSNLHLNSNLLPSQTYLTWTPDEGELWVIEETKPIWIRSSEIEWNTLTNRFSLAPTGVEYVRRDELLSLQTGDGWINDGWIDRPPQSVLTKPSNDGFYNSAVQILTHDDSWNPFYTHIDTDNDGAARLTATLAFSESGYFYSHFPDKVRISWGPEGPPTGNRGGIVKIIAGDIVPAESQIENPSPIVVKYNAACVEDECQDILENEDAQRYIALKQTDAPTYFTADGGIWLRGQIVELSPDKWAHDFWTKRTTGKNIAWGLRESNDERLKFAHQTRDFTNASFHMPGSTLNDDLAGTVPTGIQPVAMLLSATGNPNDDATLIRPNSLGDQLGLGDYAGINLRVAAQPVLADLPARQAGISCLGNASSAGTGAEAQWYSIMDYSKYYLRLSGVSGIHAAGADFPDTLSVYDYAFTFDSFGLSFLGNRNQDSVTNGNVVLPYPSDFTQEFEKLTMSCLGDMQNAKVPEGAGEKRLNYWNTNITPLTFEFRNNAPPCSTGRGFLCLGVRTGGVLLSEPLFGTLGFYPSGELISSGRAMRDDDIPDNIDSRLTAPNAFYFRGTRKPDGEYEQYYVNPVSEAYFNDWSLAQEDETARDTGFLAIAGMLNVPFFEDMKVQLQTSGTNASTAPIYISAGWEENGETYFSTGFFDAENTGYPVGDVSLKDYRNGGNGNQRYLPQAKIDWLDIINFGFPVKWHPTLRYFESPENIGLNVILLDSEANVDYLSAEETEITFGASFSGVPTANITQFAFDQLDEATGEINGFAQALVRSTTQDIADSINAGIKGGIRLTGDRLEELLTEALDEQIALVTDELYATIQAQWNAEAGAWLDIDALRLQLDGKKASLKTAIRQSIVADIAAPGQPQPPDLVAELQKELLKLQNAIRAIIGVELDTDGEIIINPDLPMSDPNLPDLDLGVKPMSRRGLMTVTKNLSDPGSNVPEPPDTYMIIPALIYAIIEDANPELAENLTMLLDGPLTELNDKVNEIFAEVQPAMQRIRSELIRLEEEIYRLRHSLDALQQPDLPDTDFRLHFEAIVAETLDGGSLEIEPMTATIMDDIHLYLTQQVSGSVGRRVDFGSLEEEEVKLVLRNIIRDRVFEANFSHELQVAIRQRIFDVDGMVRAGIDTLFSQVNEGLKGVAAEVLGKLAAELNGLLGPFGDAIKGGGIQGYAHVNGDALRKLRLDLDLQMNLPKKMDLHGFLEIKQEDSDSAAGGCTPEGVVATEIILGATEVPVYWMDSNIELSMATKCVFFDGAVVGIGGSLEMTDGVINFEGTEINDFGAAMAFGAGEAYIAARAGMRIQDYRAAGGIFFGKTCDLAPLYLVDPEVAEVLGEGSFTGAYVYGEVGMPIYGSSCAFKIEALVGAGVFFFLEGPTYGGKLVAEVSGTALCAVHVGGGITLIGVKDADGFVYSGEGRVKGRVGSCPFCLKVSKKVKAVNKYNAWSIKY